MAKPTPDNPILCFGELLWDSLPHGLFPGGAPVNVAYHLRKLGLTPIPITALGNDVLGNELLRRFPLWDLQTAMLSVIPEKPTGLVRVNFADDGGPAYEILENVAWDQIQLPEDFERRCHSAGLIVFGTLAQRSPHNRQQLERLMECTSASTKVYDVNLRPPYDSQDLVHQLCHRADLIKLNHQELEKLTYSSVSEANLEPAARRFAKETRTGCICVTAGARGAGLLLDDQWFWEPAQPVAVKDTVGAGDSFLAALIKFLLVEKLGPAKSLAHACRLAEFVASCEGAMPLYEVAQDNDQNTYRLRSLSDS